MDDLLNNQFPGFAAIMMGPAMRVGLDKLRLVTQDIGGGFGNKITSHPQLVVCCLLARKLSRAIQWTEWSTDFHQSMSHGNERWFHAPRSPSRPTAPCSGSAPKASTTPARTCATSLSEA